MPWCTFWESSWCAGFRPLPWLGFFNPFGLSLMVKVCVLGFPCGKTSETSVKAMDSPYFQKYTFFAKYPFLPVYKTVCIISGTAFHEYHFRGVCCHTLWTFSPGTSTLPTYYQWLSNLYLGPRPLSWSPASRKSLPGDLGSLVEAVLSLLPPWPLSWPCLSG